MKIVTIPHMQQRIENNDMKFGDEQAFYATPQDFLSYIKFADAVFTDSFHACVFSQVFQKQYYVFGRNEFAKMSNRITTLTHLFGTESHFVGNEMEYSLAHIEMIRDIDYSVSIDDYWKRKQNSLMFLKCNLRL